MATYKLQYFNGRGRGELTRMCFVAADKKFTDEKIAFDAWTTTKPQLPQGSVPVLTISTGIKGEKDVKLCQSMSIARYLAREFDLYGNTNTEKVYIDIILDTLLDYFNPFADLNFMKEGKDEAMEKFRKEKLPVLLKYLGDILEKNTTKSGFAVGEKLSVADLALHVYLEGVHCTDAQSGLTPLLVTNRAKTAANEHIKKYLSSRPITPW